MTFLLTEVHSSPIAIITAFDNDEFHKLFLKAIQKHFVVDELIWDVVNMDSDFVLRGEEPISTQVRWNSNGEDCIAYIRIESIVHYKSSPTL